MTPPVGYDFHGWTMFETGAEVEGTYTMPARDVTLVGHFHAHDNVPYRIEHYLQNQDGSYPTQPSFNPETRPGTTGASVTVYAHKYPGFEVDENKINAENDADLVHVSETTDYTLTDNIDGDGNLVFKFYYKRRGYNITYQFEGMVPATLNRVTYETTTANVLYGTSVDLAVIPEAEYVGYTFSGWATDDAVITDNSYFDMPSNDVLLKGSFTANLSKYTVRHWHENLPNDTSGTLNTENNKYYTMAEEEEFTHRRTGALVEATPKVYIGFSPITTGDELTGHIAGDGSLVINVYYDRHLYDVSYIYFDDGTLPDNIPDIPLEYAQTDIPYGTKLEVEDAMTLSGYSFDGWYTITATVWEENGTSVYTMPDNDVVFVGRFIKSDSDDGGGGGGGLVTRYTLQYESNGGTEFPNETYPSGRYVKLTKVPKKEGYIFDGWHLDAELTEDVTAVSMNKNVVVYAAWIEDNGSAGNGYDTPGNLNGDNHFAYIVGYPDGTVRPNDNISRAEMVSIFFRLLKESVRQDNLSKDNEFEDVNAENWYNTAVSTMAHLNIVIGRNGNIFDPDAYITRAEFASICARFDDSEFEVVDEFTDVEGHWAEDEIHEAATHGLTTVIHQRGIIFRFRKLQTVMTTI